ncbi:ankyrin repeats 3 copies domain-containing [Trichoderma arundinaceum]|uniref:protein S-acyltransferase n=1 Tax=Trichoderma arundinaceum TaxID=490622 RepID=A0A395NMS2_TRIAR|nr:ankyrin repeats 3 copies domain-containing [Trichoderma arundinaceum]
MVLDKIPTEILLQIGKATTNEKDLGALVLANRHTYQTLNAVLYEHNRKGDPKNSCVIWGANHNSLDTIKRAHSYGAKLDVYDARTEPRFKVQWFTKSKKTSRKVYSPLHAAVLKGFHEVTKYLLENGVTVDMPSVGFCGCHSTTFRPRYPAWFPLHTAICHGREGDKSAEMLIHYGARKEASGCQGLAFRAVKYQPSLARTLVNMGFLGDENRDHSGFAPIHRAALCGMAEVVKLILERPDTDVGVVIPSIELSALHCSVEQREVGTTKLLLEAPGINVNAVDCRGRTVLYAAAKGANDGSAPKIIALLVKHGANINQADESGMTPLYAAACRSFVYNYSNFMAVEALLNHGADPFSYQKNPNHWSIFHQLLRSSPNLKEVVRSRRAALTKLIELGVDFDTRSWTRGDDVGADYDSDGTPLFFAAAHAQDPECMKILLEAGARPDTAVLNREVEEYEQSFLAGVFRHMWDTPERRCTPPLSQAGEIIEMLLRHGSRLEDVNGEESALAYACRYPKQKGDYELLDFLLEKATCRNVSIGHLERLIIDNATKIRRVGRGFWTEHYDAVFHRLVAAEERDYGDGDVDDDDDEAIERVFDHRLD